MIIIIHAKNINQNLIRDSNIKQNQLLLTIFNLTETPQKINILKE